MPYVIKGQCVYKKDTHTKVGCTKGDVHKYLAALHANVDESNKLKGGKADDMSIKDIADKFNVSQVKIKNQLKKGIDVEKEHTKDADKAKEIASDHLSEIPNYYDKLDKMEKQAADELKSESTKKLIKQLLYRYI